jgi:hypothetical protein
LWRGGAPIRTSTVRARGALLAASIVLATIEHHRQVPAPGEGHQGLVVESPEAPPHDDGRHAVFL